MSLISTYFAFLHNAEIIEVKLVSLKGRFIKN